MRWIWIDRILELERGRRCVAIKNVTMAEEVLHDHFAAGDDGPAEPVMPNPLIIEGMAQTAGILVGHANDFAEKVILAKIGKARFTAAARPGDSLRFTAAIERIDASGASTSGTVEVVDPAGATNPLAEIELLFSHVDRNLSGLELPEHNFVFGETFRDLLRQSGVGEY
ncbi:MAG: beta-hydroxyacyl-ACP dehydratase [Phycisphaeraceae bacterium]|nr:beta-hydroxyacyl-ACP dehydratase [Phycisphaeraceae bacterium]